MREEVCFSVRFCLIFDGEMAFQLHFRGFSRVNIFRKIRSLQNIFQKI